MILRELTWCTFTSSEQNDGDDNEEREQDRLAKHFAKRARRNRILEEFVGDSQFSRSRLIDEDLTMQQDLKSIKVSLRFGLCSDIWQVLRLANVFFLTACTAIFPDFILQKAKS